MKTIQDLLTRLSLLTLLITTCVSTGFMQPTYAKRAAHKTHTVAVLLPDSVNKNTTRQPQTQSSYQTAVDAIKQGILAAHYSQAHAQKYPIKLIFVNTYQQAIDKQAKFVIGPLSKSAVQNLAQKKSPLPITTLALNSLQKPTYSQNIWYFGLPPENEIDALCAQAHKKKFKNALIIAPHTPWGQRVTKDCQEKWQAGGGVVTNTIFFTKKTDFQETLQKWLGVYDIQKRQAGLSKTLKKPLYCIPKIRQDVDVILLLSPPAIARQIKPSLNYYFAGDIPVYATSHIYSGAPQTQLDIDLDKIRFCDMPWVIDPPRYLRPLKEAFLSHYPHPVQQGNTGRLFALGLDSYLLAQYFVKTGHMPTGKNLSGATGQLRAVKYQITRQPVWARIKNGQVTY